MPIGCERFKVLLLDRIVLIDFRQFSILL
jgi:hypothetical protein